MSRLADSLRGLRFGIYVIFHPFKGFWELKREKRGNAASATVLLLLLLFVLILRRQLTGFVLNDNTPEDMNVLLQIGMVAGPFLLWCVANWSITTLFDGEGSMRDIYIGAAYALIPVILLNIPMLLLSRFMTLEEAALYNLLDGVSIVWAVFLVLIESMTIHQYTMLKTVGMAAVTLLGMAVMLIILLLFFSLIQQMVNFGQILYFELFKR